MQMSCTTFLAGFAAATAAVGFSIAFRERQSRRSRATRKIHERSLRFESLARTLDLAVEMTGAGQKRAMVAVVVGEELELEFVEPKLLDFLGYKHTEGIPKTVYDLIPSSMAPHHRLWVSNAIRASRLPDRLNHTLHNVEVRHASGFYVLMNLNIEWATDSPEPTFQLVFAPCPPTLPLSTKKKDRILDHVEHLSAVVVLLDIVEFTKACARLSALEVSQRCR